VLGSKLELDSMIRMHDRFSSHSRFGSRFGLIIDSGRTLDVY